LNNSQAADVLGVVESTVREDKKKIRDDRESEPGVASADGTSGAEARDDRELSRRPTITLYTHRFTAHTTNQRGKILRAPPERPGAARSG
jgi:hypothetical protein